MLTSTFSLAAISVEQQHAHRALLAFGRGLQDLESESAAGIASEAVEVACQKLHRIADFFRTRIIDVHVIPALHLSTNGLECTFAELEALSAEANEVMHAIASLVANRELSGFDIADLFAQFGRYCECQNKRVAIENALILPSAYDSLPPEVWFSIGAACLDKVYRKHEYGPTTSSAGSNIPLKTTFKQVAGSGLPLRHKLKVLGGNDEPVCEWQT